MDSGRLQDPSAVNESFWDAQNVEFRTCAIFVKKHFFKSKIHYFQKNVHPYRSEKIDLADSECRTPESKFRLFGSCLSRKSDFLGGPNKLWGSSSMPGPIHGMVRIKPLVTIILPSFTERDFGFTHGTDRPGTPPEFLGTP